MVGTRRTNQGGSIATFVVVGLILTVVLIGGIYLLNKRGQQARNDQSIATSETTKTKKPGATTSKPSESKTTQQETSGTNEATAKSDNESSSQESASDALPDTGAQDNPGQLLGLFALTIAVSAYFVSRRGLVRSL
jgi:LPXTG-motif cell wall-anchored protein